MNEEIKKLTRKSEEYSKKLDLLESEVKKAVVGQEDVIKKIIISLISDGHLLLEGVPGLAKTLMIKSMSECMGTKFARIQFTPDLLPADIMGTKIYEHKNATFSTKKGPIFTNFVLADEINRAPPKVQSALLEAMQERQVTIQGETFPLEMPFLVMATQNPIETEGTYKLPEAQVDRFMLKVIVKYPTKNQEKQIMAKYTGTEKIKLSKIFKKDEIINLQNFCRHIYCDQTIEEYVADIVTATREPSTYGLQLNGMIEYGASPRASLWLIIGAKAHAMLNGRGYVLPEDVQAIAPDVLRHRIILTYEADAEELGVDEVIKQILEKIKVP